MPGPVPAGDDIRSMLYAFIGADSLITDIIGPDNVHPKRTGEGVEIDPKTAKRPFILIRFGGSGKNGQGVTRETWIVEPHTLPDGSSWELDQICDELYWLFDETWWEDTLASQERPLQSFWGGRTQEGPDAYFQTRKVLVRILVDRV